MDIRKNGIYLDANATTAMLPKAAGEMTAVIQSGPLNPSSPHHAGEVARKKLTESRDNVALLFGQVDSENIIFTSGGTEGNWLAINSFRKCISDLVITTETEHLSVLEPVTALGSHKLIRVDENGLVDIDQLINEVKSSKKLPLVSIQWVNSETGVVQPIETVVREIRSSGVDAYIHVDAAQAVGRLHLDFNDLDFVSCSAHKLHGPHGIGLLYISPRAQESINSCFVGAGQELNWRSGTVNTPAAIGTGIAFLDRFENFDSHISHLESLTREFEKKISGHLKNIRINGQQTERVPNTANVTFFGIDGMQLLANLDAQGVMASLGSACSSAKPEPSKVLRSMGLSEVDAFSSLRFSFSVLNTMDEINKAVEILSESVRGSQ